MGYLSYAKGFKAGTFNGVATTPATAVLPIAPEHVDAYEAGLKTELFDRKLLLNLAVFRGDYRDLQVTSTIRNPSGTFTSLAANLCYLDAKWLSYANVSATMEQLLKGIRNQDLSGQPTPFAPKWSGSLTATDDRFSAQERYAKWGGRLTLDTPGRHWAFDLIGKNLNDKAIALTGGGGSGVSSSYLTEQSRSVTLQARYNW